MSSYQYRKSYCDDKTILRPSFLHNGISYTGKTTSLYWIGASLYWIGASLYWIGALDPKCLQLVWRSGTVDFIYSCSIVKTVEWLKIFRYLDKSVSNGHSGDMLYWYVVTQVSVHRAEKHILQIKFIYVSSIPFYAYVQLQWQPSLFIYIKVLY